MQRIIFLISFTLLAALPGLAAAKSMALVIGNDTYSEVAPLKKARADALGYATFFARHGIEVWHEDDATGRDMRIVVAEFLDQIDPGDTVIFVYAGHGWSDGKENYLVGTDIPSEATASRIKAESLSLQNGTNGIVDQIVAQGARLTVAIIDACRNNPFTNTDATRSIGLTRGLARAAAPRGTFVAFSAGAGQTALERLSSADDSKHSVFTRQFLAELAKPQDLQSAFKATQVAVDHLAATIGHSQRPAYYDEVLGTVCITDDCKAATDGQTVAFTPSVAADPETAARLEWQDFKEATSVEALEMFAERHEGTAYAALATERARTLGSEPAEQVVASLEPSATQRPGPMPKLAALPQISAKPSQGAESGGARTVTAGSAVGKPLPPYCSPARTATQKTICGDPGLLAMDIAIEDAIRNGQGTGAQRHALRTGLDQCNGDAACIRGLYEERLSALR